MIGHAPGNSLIYYYRIIVIVYQGIVKKILNACFIADNAAAGLLTEDDGYGGILIPKGIMKGTATYGPRTNIGYQEGTELWLRQIKRRVIRM